MVDRLGERTVSLKFERLLCAEISRLGGIVERVERNKHPKIFFRFGKRKLIHVCSATPSDKRAFLNNRAVLRRQLVASA
jgi:hypothetical protein